MVKYNSRKQMGTKNKKMKKVSSFSFKKVCRGIISSVILIVLWLSVTGFYNYLLNTPYLAVKEITVLGGNVVAPLDVIEESRVHLEENLLSVDLEDVREKLERHPWIKTAKVRRHLPSGVEITIEERNPIALMKFEEFYLIDVEGVVFKKLDKEDALDLPIITGIDMEEILKDVPEASEGIFKALDLLRILDENEFLTSEDISEIEVDSSYGLNIYTLDGAVKIGIGDRDFRKRLSRFKKIVAAMKGNFKDVRFVDLDHDKKAVLRYTRLPKGYPIFDTLKERG